MYRLAALSFVFFFFAIVSHEAPSAPLKNIKLPSGFHIEVLQDGLTDARSMALSPSGIIFVGSRGSEGVRAVMHPIFYRGPIKDRVITFGLDLKTPNGVAFHNG